MNQTQPNKPADKRNATQRLDDLEGGIMAMYQAMNQLTKEMGIVKEAITLLGNKVDSVVKATQRGEPLTDEVIDKIMVENNVDNLKKKVDDLVNQGVLAKEDQVTDKSFVVGRELNDKGEVANPRLQFVVSELEEGVKSKFPGTKVGSVMELQEGKWKFEVMESYSIVTPTQTEQPNTTQEAKPVAAEVVS